MSQPHHRTWLECLTAIFTLIFVLVSAPSASAQNAYSFSIGSITTTQSCKYFLETEYQRDAVATPWLYASSTSWRSWWVKDCVDNFRTMRSSLEAALASTGLFSVGPGGYRIDVSIADVSGGGPAPNMPDGGQRGYSFSRSMMLSSFTVTVKDRSGRIVYGGLSSKSIETGAQIRADGSYSETAMTGEAVYGIMQNEIALAIARIVAFNIVPLQVTQVDGDRIGLNYGAPFLKMGSTIEVGEEGGLHSVRFNVVSANNRTAVAEVDGDNDISRVIKGAKATFIEADDPAANGRRYRRNRLP